MPANTQVSVPVHDQVLALVLRGFTKAQIYHELERKELIDAGGSPSKSTIDRLVDRLKPADPTGPWSVAGADSEDVRLIADVLAYVVDLSEGRDWLTKGIAGWVARVRRASPDTPREWAYALAYAYHHNSATPERTRCLDLALASTPWIFGDGSDEWRGVEERCRKLGDDSALRVLQAAWIIAGQAVQLRVGGEGSSPSEEVDAPATTAE